MLTTEKYYDEYDTVHLNNKFLFTDFFYTYSNGMHNLFEKIMQTLFTN